MSKYFDVDQWLINFESTEPYNENYFCAVNSEDEPLDNKPLY